MFAEDKPEWNWCWKWTHTRKIKQNCFLQVWKCVQRSFIYWRSGKCKPWYLRNQLNAFVGILSTESAKLITIISIISVFYAIYLFKHTQVLATQIPIKRILNLLHLHLRQTNHIKEVKASGFKEIKHCLCVVAWTFSIVYSVEKYWSCFSLFLFSTRSKENCTPTHFKCGLKIKLSPLFKAYRQAGFSDVCRYSNH